MSSASVTLGIILPVLADIDPAAGFGTFGQLFRGKFYAAVGTAAGREHGGEAAKGFVEPHVHTFVHAKGAYAANGVADAGFYFQR